MNKLKKMFEEADSNKLINLVIALAIGVLMLILSSTIFKKEKSNPSLVLTETGDETSLTDKSNYALYLEKRLEDTLSFIEGAGKVKIMVTLTNSSEIVVLQDKITDESISKESDSEGGVREVTETKTDIKNVLVTGNGLQKPIVLKELEPKIEGAIVIAEGGGTAQVKDDLIKSVATILGLESHKVHVLKMK